MPDLIRYPPYDILQDMSGRPEALNHYKDVLQLEPAQDIKDGREGAWVRAVIDAQELAKNEGYGPADFIKVSLQLADNPNDKQQSFTGWVEHLSARKVIGKEITELELKNLANELGVNY